jgi:hypothetical protein
MELPKFDTTPVEVSPPRSNGRAKLRNTKKRIVPQLQFITSTGLPIDAKTDLATRRLIRAQARRSGGIKDDEVHLSATSGDDKEKTKVVRFDKKLHTSRFKVDNWSRKLNSKKTEEQETPVSTEIEEMYMLLNYLEGRRFIFRTMDPQNALPVPFIPQVRKILHYCAS